jgi:hypothetical protein
VSSSVQPRKPSNRAPRRTHRFHSSSLPSFTAGREAASGPQRAHEIKLEGFRMAGRIDKGRAQLLTRTWLDWTEKSPAAVSALANREDRLRPRRFCGTDDAGLPTRSRARILDRRRSNQDSSSGQRSPLGRPACQKHRAKAFHGHCHSRTGSCDRGNRVILLPTCCRRHKGMWADYAPAVRAPR